jgi:hypothetical protein
MKTPATALELLENLRDAIRSRAALDEAFYTEENVRLITGGSQVRVLVPEERTLEVRAIRFPAIAGEGDDGLSVAVTLKTLPDSRKKAFVSVSTSYPSLHYLEVEKLVGCPWKKLVQPQPLQANRVWLEPTDPYGYAEREYTRREDGFAERGVFRFNDKGLLFDCFITLEEIVNAG